MKKNDVGFMAGFGLGIGLAALKFISNKAPESEKIQHWLAGEWDAAIKDVHPQIAEKYQVSSFSDLLQLFKQAVVQVLDEVETQAIQAEAVGSKSNNKSSKKSASSKRLFKGIG
jgi:hypothetical protein